MSFIVNWAVDKAKDTAAGYLKTGIQAGGTLAGNTVGGVGNTIAEGGRALGEGSEFNFFPFCRPRPRSQCRMLTQMA